MKDWDTFKPNPWLPIIDAKYVKKDPFIPESPIQLIKKGKFNKTPIMIGHTKNEGKICFQCEFCDKSFSTTSDLKQHLSAHGMGKIHKVSVI